jgi:hypothetical protein
MRTSYLLFLISLSIFIVNNGNKPEQEFAILMLEISAMVIEFPNIYGRTSRILRGSCCGGVVLYKALQEPRGFCTAKKHVLRK